MRFLVWSYNGSNTGASGQVMVAWLVGIGPVDHIGQLIQSG